MESSNDKKISSRVSSSQSTNYELETFKNKLLDNVAVCISSLDNTIDICNKNYKTLSGLISDLIGSNQHDFLILSSSLRI